MYALKKGWKQHQQQKKWNNIFVMSSFSSYCCYKNIVSRISNFNKILIFFCSFWVLFSCARLNEKKFQKLIICFFHSRFSTFLIFLNFAHRHHRFVFEFIANKKSLKGHNGAIVEWRSKINYFKNFFKLNFNRKKGFKINLKITKIEKVMSKSCIFKTIKGIFHNYYSRQTFKVKASCQLCILNKSNNSVSQSDGSGYCRNF